MKLMKYLSMLLCMILFLSVSVQTMAKSTNESLGLGERRLLNSREEIIKWEIGDDSIVKVTKIYSSCFITGLKKGKTTVTGTTVKGKKVKWTITVKRTILKYPEIAVREGDTVSLNYKKVKGIHWLATDNNVTIDKNGKLKVFKEGISYIAISYKGKAYKCTVTVLPKNAKEIGFTATNNSILTSEKYYEVSLDKKKWSKKLVGLNPETTYRIYYRIGKAMGKTASKYREKQITTTSEIEIKRIDKADFTIPSKLYDNKWGSPEYLTYFTDKSGGLNTLEFKDEQITINYFNKKLEFISNKKFKIPYTKWGGFYSDGIGSYYIVAGKTNYEEKEDEAVFTVLKYDLDWNLTGSTNIYGKDSGAISPFSFGSCSMEIVENILIVHTSRLRYKTKDGLNHQSNYTFYVDTNTMTILYAAPLFPDNHVSHSLNQIIKKDGNNLIYIDHGDAYPRAVRQTTIYDFDTNNSKPNIKKSNLFTFTGSIGDAYTGTTVNDFEIGESNNIIVGMSIPHKNYIPEIKNGENTKNIYAIIVDKNGEDSSFKWLTTYDSSDVTVTEPRMVKIDPDRFLILFNLIKQDNKEQDKICSLLINSNGDILNIKYYHNYFLSGSKPIYYQGKVTWLGYEDKEERWFSIPISSYESQY